jgi:hypothetical protein
MEIKEIAVQQRQLAELNDPHLLADLGISEAQARFEASRAPWSVKLGEPEEIPLPPRRALAGWYPRSGAYRT